VRGARVMSRESYRFKDGDKLVEPDGWQAKSHRAGTQAAKKKVPAKALGQRMASVGVVLQLADVQPDAALTVEAGANNGRVTLPPAAVLAGKARKNWDGKATVRRVTTAAPLVTAPSEDDFPAAAYGPDGTLWLAYVSYALKEERRRMPLPQ